MTLTAAEREAGAGGGTADRSVSFIVFDLVFTESGGVTVPGNGDRDATDPRDRAHALLDAGPDGRAQLPGTTLAGALREMVRGERGEARAKELFGGLLDAGTADGTVDSRASQVWVLGSRRADDGSGFRTSTRISRRRDAAQENTLRTEEVLPAGARFEVYLRWDDAPPGAVAEFARLVAAWQPYLGRGVSRGRGACVTENVRLGTLRLGTPGDLLLWLTKSGPELARLAAADEVPAVPAARPEPLLEVIVSVDGPVHVGNGGEAVEDTDGVKVIPLFLAGGVPVVPGSGLKGLLRSRAEFILRGVGGQPRPCGADDGEPACGDCWTCRVFGYGGRRDEAAESVGARSMIRVPDAEIRGAVRARRTHIAIDRFTGGVLDGALYTMEVLEAGEFTLRVEALPYGGDEPVPEEQIRAVLLLVLRDLDDGIIGLGGGVARGYGTVKVRGMTSADADEARAVLRALAAGGPDGGVRDAG